MQMTSGWIESKISDIVTFKASNLPKAPNLLSVLFQLYVVANFVVSIVAAAGIIGTAASALCWQFTVTGALRINQFERFFWTSIFIFPSLAFPLLYFVLMIKASTRMQLNGIHGIIASPLSFFTSNNPASVLRTLLQDSQDIEFNLSLILGTIYLLLSQIVSTVGSVLITKF